MNEYIYTGAAFAIITFCAWLLATSQRRRDANHAHERGYSDEEITEQKGESYGKQVNAPRLRKRRYPLTSIHEVILTIEDGRYALVMQKGCLPLHTGINPNALIAWAERHGYVVKSDDNLFAPYYVDQR